MTKESQYFEKTDLDKLKIDQRKCSHDFESSFTSGGLIPYKVCRKCKAIELNQQIFNMDSEDM